MTLRLMKIRSVMDVSRGRTAMILLMKLVLLMITPKIVLIT